MIIIKVNQVKVPLEHDLNLIKKKAALKARFNRDNIEKFEVVRKSVDARKEPVYVYTVQVHLNKYNTSKIPKDVSIVKNIVTYTVNVSGNKGLPYRPVVVGFGPAGMFCSYMLALYGYKPIILERGKKVTERAKDVFDFFNGGKLNPESNIQFGEGGAGTFSDGKLNTGIKDRTGRQKLVLETFVKFGAPENILYDAKPHIGTDILCDVVKNMRNYIIEKGGEFLFESKLTDINKVENGNYQLEVNGNEKKNTRVCVLAIGHSARDTFEMLYNNNFSMEQKPFAIGVRVEHHQQLIDHSQYGVDNKGNLPASPYKVTYKTKSGRGVYSFCMCPGGYVVNASSEQNGCVVNGMSYNARNGKNANSAIVTTVTPDDFGSNHPLAGVEFQRNLEKKAFIEGKGNIPVQLLGDFMMGRISKGFGRIKPCIKGKYEFANIQHILPDYVCESIKEAMPNFGKSIKGFDSKDVVLSAIETRTSSPVRIIRNSELQCDFEDIYPCGEGAGYAGGIMSAAIDGIKVFESIITRYKNLN